MRSSEWLPSICWVRSLRPYASHFLRPCSTIPCAASAWLLRGTWPSAPHRPVRNETEWEAGQQFNADTAAAHVNLGALALERGNASAAQSHFETARRLEPYFAPASINLADVYRALGQDEQGERVLRDALARTPEVGALHYSLALLLVRKNDRPAALAALQRAAALDPRDSGVRYTLAVALYDSGQRSSAIDTLEQALRGQPGDRQLLRLLIEYVLDTGDLGAAERRAAELAQQLPGDPGVADLLARIRSRRAGR
jgi:tetratricopeptide (TPR) repeat protein